MPSSKTKIAQELTPAQLDEFCLALKDVPHGEMAAKIMELAKERGITIGRSSAYEFRNKEAMPWLERLKLRKAKAEMLTEMGDDDSGRTLADAAAAELGQLAFDFVTELDGEIDLTTKEGRATFDMLTKSVARLRSGDRAMIAQLNEQLEVMKAEKLAAEKALNAASAAGASPQLISNLRTAMNFRPPAAEAQDGKEQAAA